MASVVFGQTTTNQDGFLAIAPPPPPGNGFYMGGVYTSPYYASINGGSTVPVICDDFIDDFSAGNLWTAIITDLSAFTGGAPNVSTVYYATGASTTPPPPDVQTTYYIAAAILATEIMGYQTAVLPGETLSQLNNPSTSEAPDLSYALWGLFDPDAITTLATCPPANDVPCCLGVNSVAAQRYLTDALTEAGTFANGAAYLTAESALLGQSIDVTIYTPNASDNFGDLTPAPAPTQGNSRNQEFISVTVPEPATWAFLGFDFVGVGIVGLYFHRRNSRIRS